MSSLIRPEIMTAHTATWYTWSGGVKARRTGRERGTGWGYDVTCSCGKFETRTGGATRGSIQRELEDHRWDAQTDADVIAAGPCRTCGAGTGAYCTDDDGQPRDILHASRYRDDMAPTA